MAPGSLVFLTFSSFDLEAMGSHGACWDYVEVNHGTVSEKFCGNTVPGPITSTGNTMTVRFYSDSIFNFLAKVIYNTLKIGSKSYSNFEAMPWSMKPEGHFFGCQWA